MRQPSPELARRAAGIVVLAAIYYVAARIGLLLAFANSNATPVWPPSGIALASLALFGLRLWPGILLGAFIANYTVFIGNQVGSGWTPGLVSLAIAAGNTLEALAGAWLLRRVAGIDRPLAQLQNIYKFAIITAGVCGLAAAAGTGSLLLGDIIPGAAKWTVLSTWWLGDMAGVLVFTPLMLSWGGSRRVQYGPKLALEIGLSMLLVIGLTWTIFGQRFGAESSWRWLAYLFIPGMAWACYRHGLRGAATVVATIAGGAVIGTIRGLGPFAAGTLNDSLIALESFIALFSLIALALCADMSERRRLSNGAGPLRQIFAHWGTLLVGVGLTVFVWNLVASSTERRAHERFDALVGEIDKRIGEGIENSERGLRSAQALFKASQSVERDEWRRFVDGMNIARTLPGVLGIGYADFVGGAALDDFERAVQSDGFTGFHVHPRGKRSAYVPVKYIEPFSDRNLRAFGYDLFSDPVRRSALERARDSGEPAVTGRVRLLQELDTGTGQAGFLMFLPVYRNGTETLTTEQRRGALAGYVYSPFRMDDLMNAVLGATLSDVALAVHDGREAKPDTILFSNLAEADLEKGRYPNPFMANTVVLVGDRAWTVQVRSLSGFEDSIDRQKAQIVMVAGSLISLLFFGVVRALAARREYAVALAHDMTAALQRSEKQFESLVAAASDFSIVATDLAGVITVFSVGAERLLGYRAEDMVGKQTRAIFHLPEEIRRRSAELSAKFGRRIEGEQVFVEYARLGMPDVREWTKVRKDGSQVPVRLVISAIRDAAGKVSGYLGVASDITQERAAQMAMLHAKEQAEAASRAKSEFVANMSHEIRTPMNAVLGMTHLLGNTTLSPDQRDYLDMIRGSGQSLLRILNDILDFSKIEAGAMAISPAPFALSDLLNNLATMMTMNAGEKDIDLAIGVEPDVPQFLVGDALRVQQILVNLTSNAIKFTEQGEVSMLFEQHSPTPEQTHLRITVRDTGIGMDAEQMARLFSAFSQADASMTRRFGGTGLGLAICRRLVELMHGSIRVDSVLGQGSQFILELPFQRAAASTEPPAHVGKLRLLVVDDNQTSRAYLCKTIQAWGWQAEAASSGEDALQRMAGGAFDAVLSDWQMPGLDGLGTMLALRAQDPPFTGPVILMVSAFGRSKLLQAPGAATASAILTKPVTASSLFDTLHEALAPRADELKLSPFEARPVAARHRLDGARLLLVEDNALNQVVARGMLEQAGALVDSVGNGREALETLRKDALRYDLVLMDVQMPVMDGFTATRLIRAELKLTLPVLAMTAGVMASEQAQCIASGMNDFIAKPIDMDVMLSVIARNLGPRPPAKGALPLEALAVAPRPIRKVQAKDGGVFEPDALLELSKNNPAHRAMFLSLVGKVIERGTADIEQARQAWEAGRPTDAARLFHGMRGSIGTLGARHFAQASMEVEQAIRAGNIDAVGALFDTAERELQTTVAAARAWLAVQAPAPQPAAATEPEAPLDLDALHKLKRQLAESNLGACNSYPALRPMLIGRLADADLAALDAAIDRLDFKDAMACLARVGA